MRIRNDSVAIPWEFSQEEADTIKGMLEVPLMQAYLQSVKHQAQCLYGGTRIFIRCPNVRRPLH